MCLGFLALAALSACETPAVFPERPERLVVISNFSNDRVLKVQVSRSRPVLDGANTTEYILDATVELFEEGTFLERLKLDERDFPPSYTSKLVIPQANVWYTIKVSAPGFDPVHARSSIPSSIAIEELSVGPATFQPSSRPNHKWCQYLATISFKDPPNERNYYHLNFYQEILEMIGLEGDTIYGNGRFQRMFFSNLQNDNYQTAGANGGILLSDQRFDGQLYTNEFLLRFELHNKERLGMLLAELRSVSEDYYLFETSLTRQQSSPGEPIVAPILLYNNINNGVGIFAGYTASRDSVFLKPN
jgi:hypothetical protein